MKHPLRLCVTEFGLRPDDDGDAGPALRLALAACRERRPAVLRLPPGRYAVHHAEGVALMQQVLSGAFGADLERTLFHPSHRYPTAVDASGLEDVRIEAEGATLVLHGWMEGLRLAGCRNVEVHGLCIDYARSPFTTGVVQRCDDDHFDIRLDDVEPPLRGQTSVARCLVYDPRQRRLLPDRQPGGTHQFLPDGILRVLREPIADVTGCRIAVIHTLHFRPAVLLENSSDMVLEDVTIHAQPGMGIVGHRCRDVVLRRLQVVPRPGAFVSTNTDATHFSSCRGELRYEACRFASHGDDAINVHGYYASILRHRGATCTTTVDAPTGTHSQTLDHPEPGDELELVDRRDLGVVGLRRVFAVDNDPAGWTSDLVLDQDLPGDCDWLFLANVSALPHLTITDCHFADHVARGVLCKTRGVRIENCVFDHCGSTAIQVAPEAWWRESAASADVLIRGNRMERCGRAANVKGGGACGIAVEVDAERRDRADIHRRLRIENNTIIGDRAPRGISVSGATDVAITGNRISGCETPVHVEHCAGVVRDVGS